MYTYDRANSAKFCTVHIILVPSIDPPIYCPMPRGGGWPPRSACGLRRKAMLFSGPFFKQVPSHG